MDRIKILKEIKKTYKDDNDGLKKIKKIKSIAGLIYFLVILFAFQFHVFNNENFIYAFVFIFLSTFVLYFYSVYDSSTKTFYIIKEILDYEKIDKIIEEEDNQ